jgi:hypothetical protein
MAKKSIPVQAERSEHAKSLWFNMTRDKHRQLSQKEQVELKAHGKYTLAQAQSTSAEHRIASRPIRKRRIGRSAA